MESQTIDPMKRVRTTVATRRRMQNMKDAIEELRTTPMTQVDFALFLKFSASGARKYLGDLRKAGIVDMHEPEDAPIWYSLTTDEERVAEFIRFLDSNLEKESTPFPQTLIHKTAASHVSSDRQVHIIADDQTYRISLKRNVGEGQRDPLVAALFGTPPIPSV